MAQIQYQISGPNCLWAVIQVWPDFNWFKWIKLLCQWRSHGDTCVLPRQIEVLKTKPRKNFKMYQLQSTQILMIDSLIKTYLLWLLSFRASLVSLKATLPSKQAWNWSFINLLIHAGTLLFFNPAVLLLLYMNLRVFFAQSYVRTLKRFQEYGS